MSLLDFFKKQPKNMDIDALIDLSFQNEKELSEIFDEYNDDQRVHNGLSRKGLFYGLNEIRTRHHQHRMTMTKTDNELLDRISNVRLVVANFSMQDSAIQSAKSDFYSDDRNVKGVIKALLTEAADQPISKNKIHDTLELAINEFAESRHKNTTPVNNDDESMGMR